MEGRPPVLTDGVISLDGFTLADVQAHLAGEDEEQARRFGWWPARSTEEGVRAAIARWQEEWRSSGRQRTLAARSAEGELVGGGELRLRDCGRAEISYWVFPRYRNRGLATRIVRLLADYATTELRVERLEARIEPDNHASREVVRKAGFVEERLIPNGETTAAGEQRDVLLYARPSRPAG